MKESSKKGGSIIAAFFLFAGLFLGPLVGLIGVFLMWRQTEWSRLVKVIISFVYLSVSLILSILSLAILFYLRIGQPFQVFGRGMEPTYKEGQYLMIRLLKDNDRVLRGDVVVFQNPENPSLRYISRIIGLPGERVEIREGRVYINGKPLDESGYEDKTREGRFLREGEERIIPRGHFFVLGDNRPRSDDSRNWGFVPRSNLIGKVWFCYWNCSN